MSALAEVAGFSHWVKSDTQKFRLNGLTMPSASNDAQIS